MSISEIYADTRVVSSSQVKITWEIILEDNCSHFLVERSKDGKEFITISEQILANDIHKYTFIDHNAPDGILYYRIMQIDCVSNVNYIKILTVDKTGINNIVLPYNIIKDDLQFTALADLTDCDFKYYYFKW